jgi:hypothetical protein
MGGASSSTSETSSVSSSTASDARGVQLARVAAEEGGEAPYAKIGMHGKAARIEGPASEPGGELLLKACVALGGKPSARTRLRVAFRRRRQRRRKRPNLRRGRDGDGLRASIGRQVRVVRVGDAATLPVRLTSVAARMVFAQLHVGSVRSVDDAERQLDVGRKGARRRRREARRAFVVRGAATPAILSAHRATRAIPHDEIHTVARCRSGNRGVAAPRPQTARPGVRRRLN